MKDLRWKERVREKTGEERRKRGSFDREIEGYGGEKVGEECCRKNDCRLD